MIVGLLPSSEQTSLMLTSRFMDDDDPVDLNYHGVI